MTDYVVKPGGKKSLITFIIILGAIGVYYAYNRGYIKGRPTNKVEAPKLDEMSGKYTKDSTNYDVAQVPLPSGEEVDTRTFATLNTYDWHGNSAFTFGNGGSVTLEDSLIGKEDLKVKIVLQNDTNVSIKEFLSKAAEFKKSDGVKGGNLMFTIMGNSSIALLVPVNDELKKIDSSYEVRLIDLIGKSDGEDQMIGPAEWKTNPSAMRGKIVVGVYDDGDIQGPAVMYADKVGIPVNFDYHTWNPNALNIEHISDFMVAGKIFTNTRELDSRPVVDDDGRRTGKTTKDLGIVLRPDALASWTPVDRNIVRDLAKMDPARLQTLATISSTGVGEEAKIMPTTLVVLNVWADKNFEKLTKLSYAVHMAAIQLNKYPAALQRAMEINTDIMGIWDDGGDPKVAAAERLRAFKGYVAPNTSGLRVGGSAVFSFRDAMNMLGMTEDGDNLANSTFASVVRSFGNLTVKKYPEKNIKSFPSIEKLFDTRVLRAAYERAAREGFGTTETVTKREYSDVPSETIGSTSFKITFKTGSAEFDNSAIKVLSEIQDSYAASEYPIEVIGHTDRTGTDAVNNPLSEARAKAVKDFLTSRNVRDFGSNRITTEGKGSSEPPAGVDQNYRGVCDSCRRVEIVIHR